MQTASQAMSRINAAIDPQRLSAMMQQFAQQNERMNVTEEMMDDMMGASRRLVAVYALALCVCVHVTDWCGIAPWRASQAAALIWQAQTRGSTPRVCLLAGRVG